MKHPDQKRQTLYANLMDEVKARFDAINFAVNGRTGLPVPFVREFCWLQLRFLCELIALACLFAHGDIAGLAAHKVGRAWSADEILDRLTKLRPHFYPIPITQNPKTIDGKQGLELRITNPSPLPKEDLLQLYGATHKHLHRGTLKKLLSSTDMPLDVAVNVEDIVGYAQRMSDLLGAHAIAVDKDHVILCALKSRPDGKVNVAWAASGAVLGR
jgi:hypothetical protein